MPQVPIQGVGLHPALEIHGQDPDLIPHRREALALSLELPLELLPRLRGPARRRQGHAQILAASGDQRPELVPDDLPGPLLVSLRYVLDEMLLDGFPQGLVAGSDGEG